MTGVGGVDPRVRVCAVCARVLNRVLNRQESGGYVHPVDVPADHPPVPVLPHEVHTEGRCDFCHAAEPRWTVPARSFVFEALPGQGSQGNWSACDSCVALIERNQWSALGRRALAAHEQLHGAPAAPEVAAALVALFRQLRRNISGAPRLIDPSDWRPST